jgi:hypothetical protein
MKHDRFNYHATSSITSNPIYVNMRLLNAETKELVQFLPNKIPPYAILSHTWSSDPDEEVLFSDIGKEKAKQKPAYKQKITPACKKALKRGFDYVWIDTCCIDKSSSAELQEAVNSMFNWYSQSSICFVYLEDVPSKTDEAIDSEIEDDFITKSRWFTRGWTLQELIAPGNLIFYSKYWDKLGTRELLASSISKKTKIGKGILTAGRAEAIRFDLSFRSVANRMSWASFRETTRPEDIAYCLLGIFDVNMPLLYGEGATKAFRRLQEEILKNSDDQSLLAWTASRSDKERTEKFRGPLAEHPIEFRDAGRIAPLPGVPDTYLLTSSGLRIDLLVVPPNCLPFQDGFWGVLRCHYTGDFTGPLAIPLEPQPWQGNKVYARRKANLITIDRSKLTNHDIFQNGPFASQKKAHPQNQTIIIQRNPKRLIDDCEHLHLESWPNDCTLIQAIPEEQWDSRTRIMGSDDYNVTRVFIFEHVSSKTRFAVVFGYSFRFPQPTLGNVKVFKLDPGMLSSPPWLQDGKPEPWMDWEWEVEHFWDPDDTVHWYDSKGVKQGIGAALRKGHIMGVPFFVINVESIKGSALKLREDLSDSSG